jgi:protein CpxP
MRLQMNRRRWLGLSLVAVAGAGALGALLAAPALGGPRGLFGHGPRFGHHGAHRFDEAHVRRHVEWVLRGVDPSEAQVDEITRITTAAAQEMHAGRDRAADHAKITAALSGARVDREALEALRAGHVAALDAASVKLTEALAQVAEVLTPEQRAELAEEHAKFFAADAE